MKQAYLVLGLATAMMIGSVASSYAADPRVVCKDDYKRYCFGVSPQGGALAKCFKRNFNNLSKLCVQSLVDAKMKQEDEADTASNGQTPPD